MTPDPRASLKSASDRIHPVLHHYADKAIEEGFDWSSLDGVPFERLYLVVFRSIRREDADVELLREHDDRAYEEAIRSGGLLRYFKGTPNERRECLSFCLWETREQAVRAAGAPQHGRAAEISYRTYERYDLERYDVLKGDGAIEFRPVGPLAHAI